MMNRKELAVAWLEATHVADLKLAASKILGAPRRAFEAEIVGKYGNGNALWGEKVFGWGRHTIALGLAEMRTGIVCLGAQEAFCGNKQWEEKYPQATAALLAVAESHAQQDPSFRGTLAYIRLTAQEAREQLQTQGFADGEVPSPSAMAEILYRNGYRLRPVVKAKPPKSPGNRRKPETDGEHAGKKNNRQQRCERYQFNGEYGCPTRAPLHRHSFCMASNPMSERCPGHYSHSKRQAYASRCHCNGCMSLFSFVQPASFFTTQVAA
jgi:hypothetical protein